jgi:hypothetical protein
MNNKNSQLHPRKEYKWGQRMRQADGVSKIKKKMEVLREMKILPYVPPGPSACRNKYHNLLVHL